MFRILILLSFFLCMVQNLCVCAADTSKEPLNEVKVLLFDVFGTVVDWRGSIILELTNKFTEKNITGISAAEFTDAWVAFYPKNIKEINAKKVPFVTLDVVNSRSLNFLLKKYKISNKFTNKERKEIVSIWHRLKPWYDSVLGLAELKKHFIVGTLSNGNVKMLVDLSKHGQLEWDVVFSGEIFKKYKPDPSVYLSALRILDLKPSEVMLVASHKFDLHAAKKLGLKTAHIYRPTEYGDAEDNELPSEDDGFDINTFSLEQLAKEL